MNRPKINVIEQINTIHHDAIYDDDNNLISESYDEPVYGAVTREMNDEEYAEYEASQNSTESIQMEIESLKGELSSTDYKAIKYAEGYYTDEDYAPIKAHRQELRDRINELEGRV